jgi:hypothetical protein
MPESKKKSKGPLHKLSKILFGSKSASKPASQNINALFAARNADELKKGHARNVAFEARENVQLAAAAAMNDPVKKERIIFALRNANNARVKRGVTRKGANLEDKIAKLRAANKSRRVANLKRQLANAKSRKAAKAAAANNFNLEAEHNIAYQNALLRNLGV